MDKDLSSKCSLCWGIQWFCKVLLTVINPGPTPTNSSDSFHSCGSNSEKAIEKLQKASFNMTVQIECMASQFFWSTFTSEACKICTWTPETNSQKDKDTGTCNMGYVQTAGLGAQFWFFLWNPIFFVILHIKGGFYQSWVWRECNPAVTHMRKWGSDVIRSEEICCIMWHSWKP